MNIGSSPKASKSTAEESDVQICISCQAKKTEKLQVRKAPCSHWYCNNCIRDVCLNALNDRAFIPVRCCKQVFVQEWVADVLDPAEMARYVNFQKELLSTSFADIDPDYARMVETLGWKLCPRCKVGIDKIEGCTHMTCSACSHQFCFGCLASWVPRACSCELFPAEELDRIIQERAPRANPVEQERLRQVYRLHDQHVHSWTRITLFGKYVRCSNCPWVCNQWYWNCRECRTEMCGRCAFNGGDFDFCFSYCFDDITRIFI